MVQQWRRVLWPGPINQKTLRIVPVANHTNEEGLFVEWGSVHPLAELWASTILSADRITTYLTLDSRHLMVSLEHEQSYLITLQSACVQLGTARHIGVTMSGNTIWAGFDSVTADGSHCAIHTIEKVSSKQAEALARGDTL